MTNRESNTIEHWIYKYFLNLLINNDTLFKTGTLQSDKSPFIFWQLTMGDTNDFTVRVKYCLRLKLLTMGDTNYFTVYT